MLTKKVFGLILSSIMLVVVSFATPLRNTSAIGDVNLNGYISTSDYEAWTAPSTVKIIKEEEFNGKGSMEMNYSCVKNEYESIQLGITAKTNINSYYLTPADLSDGNGHILSSDNFTVYNEFYYYFDGNSVDASANYYKKSMLKSYPDALVPMENSYKAGECKVKSGQNAALWITVYIPEDTDAGIYSGNFKLEINGKSHDVPVKVNVKDYTLTNENHAGSTFTMRNYKIGVGEMDTSVQMLEKYYEFALDYRISPRTLPQENVESIEEFISLAKKYYNRYSNYALGKSGNITLGLSYDYVLQQLLAIAENSTEEMNLMSKAIFYAMDEPNLNDEKTLYSCVSLVRRIKAVLEETVEIIEHDDSGKYANFKLIDGWKDMVIDIPNVVPFGSYSYVENAINSSEPMKKEYAQSITWCPLWNVYDDSNRNAYLNLAENAGNPHLWWYSCTGPAAPYATYHIADDNLLSSRTISWLQKKYNIEGNLYWDIVGYGYDTLLSYTDMYIDPHVAKTFAAGDGNLCYPGAKYGYYGPLPSIRLMSIRDGLEEYEMLLDIENKNKSLFESYDVNADIDDSMSVYYSQLAYSGARMFADGEGYLDFGSLRSSLLNSVTDNVSGFVISNINTYGSESTIEFYIKNGFTVKVNGENQTSVGNNKYIYNLNLNSSSYMNVEVYNGTNLIYKNSFFIEGQTVLLSSFDALSSGVEIESAEGGDIALNKNSAYSYSGNSLAYRLVTYGMEDFDYLTWAPMITIKSSIFEQTVDFSNVFSLSFYVYNKGNECSMGVYLGTGQMSQLYTNARLLKGMNHVTVSIAKGTAFSKISEVDRIILQFENTASAGEIYEGYLDNLTVNFK